MKLQLGVRFQENLHLIEKYTSMYDSNFPGE